MNVLVALHYGMKLRTPGKWGHTFANSGNPDETAPYEQFHQDFHCSLSWLFFYSNNYNMNNTRSLSEFTRCPKIPDFTLTLSLLGVTLSSANNLCKQLGPRSGLTKSLS